MGTNGHRLGWREVRSENQAEANSDFRGRCRERKWRKWRYREKLVKRKKREKTWKGGYKAVCQVYRGEREALQGND